MSAIIFRTKIFAKLWTVAAPRFPYCAAPPMLGA